MERIIFIALLGTGIGLIISRVLHLRRAIQLGKPDRRPLLPWQDRLRTIAFVALGQRRMFDKPLVGVLHGIIYVGFILINLDVLEFILDGLGNTHRIFASLLGGQAYGVLINGLELVSVLVLGACLVFLWRRNIGHVPRLAAKKLNSEDIKGWPRLDANLILVAEVILASAFLLYNAMDIVLQARGVWASYTSTSTWYISQFISTGASDLSTTHVLGIAHVAWWGHIIGVLAFGYYVTFSKHLHIVLAFIKAYYHRGESTGTLALMPAVQATVLAMFKPNEPIEPLASGHEQDTLGAQEVTDLTRTQVLEAYSCTECGRCTEACPSHQAGKKLSPRRIMMAVRDRASDLLAKRKGNSKLLPDYISYEEIQSCTTCQACVWACPIQLNPLDIILDLRRYQAMETQDTPKAWQQLFSHVENNGAPWPFPAHKRGEWVKKIKGNGETS